MALSAVTLHRLRPWQTSITVSVAYETRQAVDETKMENHAHTRLIFMAHYGSSQRHCSMQSIQDGRAPNVGLPDDLCTLTRSPHYTSIRCLFLYHLLTFFHDSLRLGTLDALVLRAPKAGAIYGDSRIRVAY